MISNIDNYLNELYKLEIYDINNDIYNNYKNFSYNNKELFKLHLDFLLNNIYINIKITKL